MKIVVLSDIHGCLRHLSSLVSDLEGADCLAITGDLTNFGGAKQTTDLIGRLSEHIGRIAAVHGNCDFPVVRSTLSNLGISVEDTPLVFDGIRFVGVGGSLACPGKTPAEFTEAQFDRSLSLFRDLPPAPTVLLTHQPPLNTIADRAGGAGHVGSRAVRQFVDDCRPLLCLCGHIHESRGVGTVGATTIVNPGAFRDGFYAKVTIDTANTVRAEMRAAVA